MKIRNALWIIPLLLGAGIWNSKARLPSPIADASDATSLLLSANGATLAVWGDAGVGSPHLKVIDIASRRALLSSPIGLGNSADVLALSEGGKSLLLSRSEGKTQNFQWLALGEKNRIIWTQKNSRSPILAARFEGRNAVLLRGNGIETRASSGRIAAKVALETPYSSPRTLSAALSGDAKLAALGSGDSIRIFEARSGKLRHQLQITRGQVMRIGFSPRSKWLEANVLFGDSKATYDARELIWNAKTGALRWGADMVAWPQRAYCNYDRALLTQEKNSTDDVVLAWRDVQTLGISQQGPRPALFGEGGSLKFTRDEKMAAWLDGGKIWVQKFG